MSTPPHPSQPDQPLPIRPVSENPVGDSPLGGVASPEIGPGTLSSPGTGEPAGPVPVTIEPAVAPEPTRVVPVRPVPPGHAGPDDKANAAELGQPPAMAGAVGSAASPAVSRCT